jgi:hypothetical protein
MLGGPPLPQSGRFLLTHRHRHPTTPQAGGQRVQHLRVMALKQVVAGHQGAPRIYRGVTTAPQHSCPIRLSMAPIREPQHQTWRSIISCVENRHLVRWLKAILSHKRAPGPSRAPIHHVDRYKQGKDQQQGPLHRCHSVTCSRTNSSEPSMPSMDRPVSLSTTIDVMPADTNGRRF